LYNVALFFLLIVFIENKLLQREIYFLSIGSTYNISVWMHLMKVRLLWKIKCFSLI
jgi:hypothetical protein